MANASIYAAFERMWQHVIARLSKLEGQLSEKVDEPIIISGFGDGIQTQELGATISNIGFSWVLSRPAISQVIKSTQAGIEETISTTGTSFAVSFKNLSLSDTTEFELVVMDERGNEYTATTTIKFANGVYYGVLDSNNIVSSDTIRNNLTKQLQSIKNIIFTTNADANQYIYYAFPARYGTPKFYVDGFIGGFHEFLPINVTNSFGYTEKYSVWRSDNKSLGETTVRVLGANEEWM